MKKWLIRLIAAGVLIGLGIWLYGILFPGPEKIIRKRLSQIAQTASFDSDEGTIVRMAKVEHLASFCAPDVECIIDTPDIGQHTFSGRNELTQAAMAARSTAASLHVRFLDIAVTIAPDNQNGTAELTAEISRPGEKDFGVLELRFTFRKVGSDWLISKIETVKTLY